MAGPWARTAPVGLQVEEQAPHRPRKVAAVTGVPPHNGTVTTHITDPQHLRDLGDRAVTLARDWATRAAAEPVPASARLLSQMLADPDGLDFILRFVDDVIRPHDPHVAATALARLAARPLPFLPAPLRSAVKAARVTARTNPQLTVAATRRAFRDVVGDLVVDVTDRTLPGALKRLSAGGNRLNVNLLGEAVLGDAEATRRLDATAALVARDDVTYVSLKVSSVIGPHNPWDFDGAVERAVERLRPLYRLARDHGTFLNLDMEWYAELDLTLEVFTRLLSEDEFSGYRAGIVLQAYLPDSLAAMQRLQEFAAARVARGGAPIKVRVVKGANLAMERVEAEVRGWELVTWPDKQSTDAHYKRVLDWAMTPERIRNVNLGVASQNLFEIAFAHLLAESRGVDGPADPDGGPAREVEFEMLSGMASGQATVVAEDLGPLVLYVPVVDPAEFDVAIAYLVRRLEENSQPDNFMSGIFDLDDAGVFDRERDRFLASLEQFLTTDEVPGPRRTQDRSRTAEAGPAEESAQTPEGAPDVVHPTPAFTNTPDSDPSLAANRAWAREIAARIPDSRLGEDAEGAAELGSTADVDALVSQLRDAAAAWAARPARERADILRKAAVVLEQRRGELLEVAASEVGKLLDQADTEVSEAIDFANYYAAQAEELEDLDGAVFTPVALTVVASPWNFPLAIPAGGVLAALAAGSAVVLKPAPPARRCGAEIARALWDAGVPREVFALADLPDGDVSRALVVHEGVERVVLTGAYETAALFRSWRPDLPLLAETSGKNAIIVTPSADPDAAVRDIVNSAFSSSGQKCSASSLVVLVGAMARSERFRDQLVDAVRSLRVGPPEDLTSEMGPLVMPDDEKLRRGLTVLEEGQTWAVPPQQLDDEGRLWSPGLRAGVAMDSEYHLTEYFGPILGIMTADDLGAAIEIVNRTDFGLTSGLHSLDPEEVVYWMERVHAGNLYVNRGITGAIVRRQPFGGWKRSGIGAGAKAGGPNYLLGFGSVAPSADVLGTRAPKVSAARRAARPLLRATKPHLSKSEWRSLRRAAASDAAMWDARFGRDLDVSGLHAETNVLRYKPVPVVVRAGAEARLEHTVRVVAAGLAAGAIVTLSHEARLPASVAAALRESRVTTRQETEDQWAYSATAYAGSRPLDGRIRLVDGDASQLARHLDGSPDVAVWADPVTESGRVEMLPFLREQAVSITAHRFGMPMKLVEF